MNTRHAGLLMLTAAFGPGCAHPLPLRADVSRAAPAVLGGFTVAVSSVTDRRPETGFVGRHRDGLARVPQWRWVATPPLEQAVHAMLVTCLAVAGARVVDPGQAEHLVSVEVLEADVTDDAFLAGEETFGRVRLHLVMTDGRGAIVKVLDEHLTFTEPERDDPGLLGQALYDVLVKAVAQLGVASSSPVSLR